MKIALVTDWFAPRVGGIEVHVRELATRLRQRGIEAVVLTPWPGPADVAGVPVERIPVGVVPGLGVSLSPRLVGRLGDAIRRGRFDVVHGHMSIGSSASMAAGFAAHRSGVPSVGTFHSVLGRWRHAYALAAPVMGWRRWPFRVTAVSEVVARELRVLMPDRSVTLLPPAIDPDVWSASPPPPAAGRLRLVTTSRLHPRKRVDALLEIVADVRARMDTGVDVTLDVLGDGAHRAALEKLAGRLRLGDAVRFLGAGTERDVRAMLARGDVFVSASIQESFGIAGLEALASGLPVVARGEGGMTSFVGHEKNGLLCDSDASMAAALAALAGDAPLLATLRAGAARGIPAAYQWDGSVDRHAELYRGLLQPSGGAAKGVQEFA